LVKIIDVVRNHQCAHNFSMTMIRLSGSQLHAARVLVGLSRSEVARVALNVADRGDLANEVIAKRIIELAKTGELNPDVLCEGVVKEFREQRL
jgi:hypothetical protein